MAGTGRTYRVVIDVARIQQNLLEMEGGRLTELAVRNWLRAVGFTPEADGRTWLSGSEGLGRLDKSEIVSVEAVATA